MPRSPLDGIRSAVRKAKATKDEYVQAAKDLARAPGAVRQAVVPYKELGQAMGGDARGKAASDRINAARRRMKK